MTTDQLQQENETLRTLLGMTLGMYHNSSECGWDECEEEYYDWLTAELERLGIESIDPPQHWNSPAEIAEGERNLRMQAQKSRLMEELGLIKRCTITRDDIINDDLFKMRPSVLFGVLPEDMAAARKLVGWE